MEIAPINVSVVEAARLLGCGRTRIYVLISDGLLDARKDGNRTVISVASLNAYASNLPKAEIKLAPRRRATAAA